MSELCVDLSFHIFLKKNRKKKRAAQEDWVLVSELCVDLSFHFVSKKNI